MDLFGLSEAPEIALKLPIYPQEVRIQLGDVFLKPFQTALIVEPVKSDSKTLETVAKTASTILENLPHTRVSAMGHNIAYRLETGEDFNLDLAEIRERVQASVQDQVSRSKDEASIALQHAFQVEGEPFKLTINLQSKPDERVLAFNFHYDMGDTPIDERSKSIVAFCENYKLAESLKSRLVRSQ